MKSLFLLIFSVLTGIASYTQNIDSILAQPQVLELTLSTPQPRMGESYQITLDINRLRANIFKSIAAKVRLDDDISITNDGVLKINVTALKKGKNEIGPLEFYLDKTKYTTNKVTYEVIDALPKTDKGLWFRKVMTSDSTFCIIIDQRIPANSKTTTLADNSISFTTEPEHKEIAGFKDSYSIEGLDGNRSFTSTSFSSVEINGTDRQYMYGFSIYHFKIRDKKAKITITRDKFQNIPDDYKFEDIVIQ